MNSKWLAVWLALGIAFGVFNQAAAQSSLSVYTDGLQNGWQIWGWATTINDINASPVHSGSRSISVTIGNNSYQAIYFHHSALDTATYDSVSFWIHGGASGGSS